MSEKRKCLVCLEIWETSMYTSMLLNYFIFVRRTWHPKASNNSFMSSRINEAWRTTPRHSVPSNHLTCSHHILPHLPLVSYTCTAGTVTVDAGTASEQHRYWVTVASQNWGFHSVRSTNSPIQLSIWKNYYVPIIKTSTLLPALAGVMQRVQENQGE